MTRIADDFSDAMRYGALLACAGLFTLLAA